MTLIQGTLPFAFCSEVQVLSFFDHAQRSHRTLTSHSTLGSESAGSGSLPCSCHSSARSRSAPEAALPLNHSLAPVLIQPSEP